MITRLMKHCNNYFPFFREENTFTISNNTINVTKQFVKGMYIWINGSLFNDGCHLIDNVSDGKLTVIGLVNETFYGNVIALRVPKDFIELSNEIKDYTSNTSMSSPKSESIPNYSYTANTGTDGSIAWQSVFKNNIVKFMKFHDDNWISKVYDQ